MDLVARTVVPGFELQFGWCRTDDQIGKAKHGFRKDRPQHATDGTEADCGDERCK